MHKCTYISINEYIHTSYIEIRLEMRYYLAFQSFDFERTWWRLFQKRVVRTKFDIFVFTNILILAISDDVKNMYISYNG